MPARGEVDSKHAFAMSAAACFKRPADEVSICDEKGDD
jgi:hypothetical protein